MACFAAGMETRDIALQQEATADSEAGLLKAVALFKSSYMLSAGNPSHESSALAGIAMCYCCLGSFSDDYFALAEPLAADALERDACNYTAQHALGWAFINLGKMNEGEALLKMAHEKQPDNRGIVLLLECVALIRAEATSTSSPLKSEDPGCLM
jgi:hypothetical protein